ncbi:hypothetical protein SAMN05421594_1495 [Chryseobacterium oleae]|uniref:Uncharacterized protein n=1 Tax=Chryseobacterium oleae TaxID=491207 RepID=A0A1I4X5J6_CHROL|nr:hypothetical protein SAMN05421594_1495 [Chryseobacterium oleae]
MVKKRDVTYFIVYKKNNGKIIYDMYTKKLGILR